MKRSWGLIGLSALALALVWAVVIGLGRYPVSWGDIGRQLLSLVNPEYRLPETSAQVLLNVRLPRLVLVTLVGAGLSVAGATYQGMFRNPLVSPDLLGVSQGASLGAALTIIIFDVSSAFWIQAGAFVLGMGAVALAYGIARSRGLTSTIMLVLAGVVVSSFCSALLSFVQYIADPYTQLPTLLFWLMGGFYTASWNRVLFAAPGIITGLTLLLLLRWRLNILSLGDEEALALGINVSLARALYIGAATLVVASSVAVSGVIGWVGLVIPHVTRMLGGPDHRLLLPLTVFIGAAFLLLMDTLARSITGGEIPIGVMTSFIGAPFFAYLLRRRGEGWS